MNRAACDQQFYLLKFRTYGNITHRSSAVGEQTNKSGNWVLQEVICANGEEQAHEIAERIAKHYGADSYELKLDDDLNTSRSRKVSLREYNKGNKQAAKGIVNATIDKEQAY